MAPSHCTEFNASERDYLLAVARDALEHGLASQSIPVLDEGCLPRSLCQRRAAFVTLYREHKLRGCVGTMEAQETLATVVAGAAFDAAFNDRRFPELQYEELDALSIEISVLSPLELLSVQSRCDLLALLQPHRDGLLLEEGIRRATFLPKVWQQLPDPELFLQQLLQKAGMPANYWSGNMAFHRYQTVTFNDSGISLISPPTEPAADDERPHAGSMRPAPPA